MDESKRNFNVLREYVKRKELLVEKIKRIPKHPCNLTLSDMCNIQYMFSCQLDKYDIFNYLIWESPQYFYSIKFQYSCQKEIKAPILIYESMHNIEDYKKVIAIYKEQLDNYYNLLSSLTIRGKKLTSYVEFQLDPKHWNVFFFGLQDLNSDVFYYENILDKDVKNFVKNDLLLKHVHEINTLDDIRWYALYKDEIKSYLHVDMSQMIGWEDERNVIPELFLFFETKLFIERLYRQYKKDFNPAFKLENIVVSEYTIPDKADFGELKNIEKLKDKISECKAKKNFVELIDYISLNTCGKKLSEQKEWLSAIINKDMIPKNKVRKGVFLEIEHNYKKLFDNYVKFLCHIIKHIPKIERREYWENGCVSRNKPISIFWDNKVLPLVYEKDLEWLDEYDKFCEDRFLSEKIFAKVKQIFTHSLLLEKEVKVQCQLNENIDYLEEMLSWKYAPMLKFRGRILNPVEYNPDIEEYGEVYSLILFLETINNNLRYEIESYVNKLRESLLNVSVIEDKSLWKAVVHRFYSNLVKILLPFQNEQSVDVKKDSFTYKSPKDVLRYGTDEALFKTKAYWPDENCFKLFF